MMMDVPVLVAIPVALLYLAYAAFMLWETHRHYKATNEYIKAIDDFKTCMMEQIGFISSYNIDMAEINEAIERNDRMH